MCSWACASSCMETTASISNACHEVMMELKHIDFAVAKRLLQRRLPDESKETYNEMAMTLSDRIYNDNLGALMSDNCIQALNAPARWSATCTSRNCMMHIVNIMASKCALAQTSQPQRAWIEELLLQLAADDKDVDKLRKKLHLTPMPALKDIIRKKVADSGGVRFFQVVEDLMGLTNEGMQRIYHGVQRDQLKMMKREDHVEKSGGQGASRKYDSFQAVGRVIQLSQSVVVQVLPPRPSDHGACKGDMRPRCAAAARLCARKHL